MQERTLCAMPLLARPPVEQRAIVVRTFQKSQSKAEPERRTDRGWRHSADKRDQSPLRGSYGLECPLL